MKVLSLRKISFIIALTLGIVTLWSVATPKAIGGNTVDGGWYYTNGRPPCDGVDPNGVCPDGDEGSGYQCAGGDLITCNAVESDSRHCRPTGPIRCTGAYPYCWVADAICD